MDINRLREKCQGFAQCFDTIEKRVTLCATEVIDAAMSEKNPNWFSAFRGKELRLPENSVIERRHNSIRDLDFQPAIKLFLYRESKVDYGDADTWNISAVFEKYNLPRTFSADRPSRFKKLVSNLIFSRNELTGHLSAEEIEAMLLTATEKELEDIIFKYRESIQELISFLAYFPEVKGNHPVAHFEYAKNLLSETEKKYDIVKYHAIAVIGNEGLGVSENDFADICRNIRVNTSTVDGVLYFETDDYARTIQIIRAMLETRAAATAAAVQPEPERQRVNYLPAIAIILSLLLVLGILLALLIPRLSGNTDNTSSNPKPKNNKGTSVSASSDFSSSDPSSTSKKGKIRGEATIGTLTFTIDQKPSNVFGITVENSGGNSFCLGWVEKAQVVIETSEDTYYSTVYEKPSFKIEPGSTKQFTVNFNGSLNGDIQKITIKNILPLSASGLPEGSDVVGYQAIINIEHY